MLIHHLYGTIYGTNSQLTIFLSKYAAIYTIVVSCTLYPKSAVFAKCHFCDKISSRHCWNDIKESPAQICAGLLD